MIFTLGKWAVLPLALILAACNSGIYLQDGVTDGDTFYLANRALSDDDPVLQSWVSYSLTKSTCQLQIGGDNPARVTSFDCELTARRLLLDTWQEQKSADAGAFDTYLDQLADVRSAGFLDEYVARYLGQRHWQLPGDLEIDHFNRWQRNHLPHHRPQTQIIGSWNYARNVSPL